MELYDRAYAQANRILQQQKPQTFTCWGCDEKTDNCNGGPEGQPLCDSCHDDLNMSEPEDHSDDICPCGDFDCNRPYGHA